MLTSLMLLLRWYEWFEFGHLVEIVIRCGKIGIYMCLSENFLYHCVSMQDFIQQSMQFIFI